MEWAVLLALDVKETFGLVLLIAFLLLGGYSTLELIRGRAQRARARARARALRGSKWKRLPVPRPRRRVWDVKWWIGLGVAVAGILLSPLYAKLWTGS